MFGRRHFKHVRGSRSERLVLRRVHGRSERQVRTTLGEGAAIVEHRLKQHVRRVTGHLPGHWLERMERRQLAGDGWRVPDMVCYVYEGEEVLTVWTGVVSGDLHIIFHPPASARRDARPVAPPMIWDEAPWTYLMGGA